jgi:hypothetical protein
MSRGQKPAPKVATPSGNRSRTSNGIGGSRRIPLPCCRSCDARLTRKAKNAAHVICARCSSKIVSTVTFTLATKVKA